ncbi:SRPBCC domain-containing protein [Paeniglutamicibacter sp.]|uniref:SRPBCC domain-containing protein n=1 Tax=Paeniglutamicibacter sp. TaxID=1934391 RepID=UPI00398A45A6
MTDPQQTAVFCFGNTFTSEWSPGSSYATHNPNAQGQLGEGKVLEIDAPRKPVMTVTALWDDEVKAEGESRVGYEIREVGDSYLLTVSHDELREGSNHQLYGGWPTVLSGMKSWLETGECLTTPGSLMYTLGR